jgi:hypothetical protein
MKLTRQLLLQRHDMMEKALGIGAVRAVSLSPFAGGFGKV